MSRMNIRISGLGGQGAVTAAHLLAMAANKDGKFSISKNFFEPSFGQKCLGGLQKVFEIARVRCLRLETEVQRRRTQSKTPGANTISSTKCEILGQEKEVKTG